MVYFFKKHSRQRRKGLGVPWNMPNDHSKSGRNSAGFYLFLWPSRFLDAPKGWFTWNAAKDTPRVQNSSWRGQLASVCGTISSSTGWTIDTAIRHLNVINADSQWEDCSCASRLKQGIMCFQLGDLCIDIIISYRFLVASQSPVTIFGPLSCQPQRQPERLWISWKH